jgi:hypothetical protein
MLLLPTVRLLLNLTSTVLETMIFESLESYLTSSYLDLRRPNPNSIPNIARLLTVNYR